MLGTTIDLGAHEDALRAALAARGVPYDMRTLAPAVADWLRWKFRRYQIDRTDAARWERVLAGDLPRRVKDAGPPPAVYQAARCARVRPRQGARYGRRTIETGMHTRSASARICTRCNPRSAGRATDAPDGPERNRRTRTRWET